MGKKVTFLTLFIIFAKWHPVWAYHGEVHYKINEEAVLSSQLETILKTNLNIAMGRKAELTKGKETKQIINWIAYGGEGEDFGKSNIPILKDLQSRAYNHFHDPLKSWWDTAGLDNNLTDHIYNYHYGRDPVSSILWGLVPGQQDFPRNSTGDWSWSKAREY